MLATEGERFSLRSGDGLSCPAEFVGSTGCITAVVHATLGVVAFAALADDEAEEEPPLVTTFSISLSRALVPAVTPGDCSNG